jgi:hypothetical protein
MQVDSQVDGPEFVAKAVQEWIVAVGACLHRAGQPVGERLHRELSIRPHASIGYKPPAPEVFVPAFAAWPATLRPPAQPATLAQRPSRRLSVTGVQHAVSVGRPR